MAITLVAIKDWLGGFKVANVTSEQGTPHTASIPAFVQVDTSGNPVSGGTGASASQVQGNAASGAADAGNPIKTGGVFNTTPPTVTNGQRVDTQATANGFTIVTPQRSTAAAFADGASNSGSILAGITSAGSAGSVITQTYGYGFNGTTWDRLKTLNGTTNDGLGSQAVGLTKLNGTQLTRQTVNITTATTTAIVTATASQAVRVYKMVLNVAAAQTLNIISSGGTSLVGAAMSFGANGGLVLDFDGEPWYVSVTGEGLSFVTTTTGAVTGTVYYRKEA